MLIGVSDDRQHEASRTDQVSLDVQVLVLPIVILDVLVFTHDEFAAFTRNAQNAARML